MSKISFIIILFDITNIVIAVLEKNSIDFNLAGLMMNPPVKHRSMVGKILFDRIVLVSVFTLFVIEYVRVSKSIDSNVFTFVDEFFFIFINPNPLTLIKQNAKNNIDNFI